MWISPKLFLDQLKRLNLIRNWLLISCCIILLASINWHLSPRSTLAQWVYVKPSTKFQIKPQHRQTHYLYPSAILPSNGLSSRRSYIHPLCQFSRNLQITTATSPRFLPKEVQKSLMQNFTSREEQGETWLYLHIYSQGHVPAFDYDFKPEGNLIDLLRVLGTKLPTS